MVEHSRRIRAEYLRAVDEHAARIRRECSTMRVDYQLVNTRTPFDQVLSRYLDRRQRLG